MSTVIKMKEMTLTESGVSKPFTASVHSQQNKRSLVFLPVEGFAYVCVRMYKGQYRSCC